MGFSGPLVNQYLERAGLIPQAVHALKGNPLTVNVWTAVSPAKANSIGVAS
jgi:hypothetical protein